MTQQPLTWTWLTKNIFLVTVHKRWTVQAIEQTTPLLNNAVADVAIPYYAIIDIKTGILSLILNLIASARLGDPTPEERARASRGQPPTDPELVVFVHSNPVVRWILIRISEFEKNSDVPFIIVKSVKNAKNVIQQKRS